MALVPDARSTAAGQLAVELPRRWVHVQAVAAKAERVATIVPESDRPVLIAAAWLHDVGYSTGVASTGFHPLDGARWLRLQGFDERVVGLVAHHSCALIEAQERGLADDLVNEFPHEASPAADTLWYCDLTTGPDGQDFTVDLDDEVGPRSPHMSGLPARPGGPGRHHGRHARSRREAEAPPSPVDVHG